MVAMLSHSTDRERYEEPERTEKLGICELVTLVQHIQAEHRPATPHEQHQLGTFMGWGPYAPAFTYNLKDKWAEVGAGLRMLLGPEGYEAASAATPTSFFTAFFIRCAIWEIATGLGFSGGRVLEPGCGNGAFMGSAPVGMPISFTGIEREPFTASLAALCFPEARIITAPLEKAVIIDEFLRPGRGQCPIQ